jgi:putative membrane protein
MNTNIESRQTVERDKTWIVKLISSLGSVGLGLALVAAGILVAVPRAGAATTVSTVDNDFMQAVNQGNMTEVQMGDVAASTGQRSDVRSFGRRMVKDHTALNDELKVLVARKGVTLLDSMDGKHERVMDKMSALTGSEFDDAYIAGMIKDHQKVVQAFKAEYAATTDADIKNFVDKSLPIIEEHLKLITAMQK